MQNEKTQAHTLNTGQKVSVLKGRFMIFGNANYEKKKPTAKII